MRVWMPISSALYGAARALTFILFCQHPPANEHGSPDLPSVSTDDQSKTAVVLDVGAVAPNDQDRWGSLMILGRSSEPQATIHLNDKKKTYIIGRGNDADFKIPDIRTMSKFLA